MLRSNNQSLQYDHFSQLVIGHAVVFQQFFKLFESCTATVFITIIISLAMALFISLRITIRIVRLTVFVIIITIVRTIRFGVVTALTATAQ